MTFNFRDVYGITPAVSPASIPYHRIKTENLARYSQKEFKNSKLTKIATIQIKETDNNSCDVDGNSNLPCFIWCPAKIKEPAMKVIEGSFPYLILIRYHAHPITMTVLNFRKLMISYLYAITGHKEHKMLVRVNLDFV